MELRRVFLVSALFSDKNVALNMNVELEKGQHYNEGKIFPFVLKCPEKPEKE